MSNVKIQAPLKSSNLFELIPLNTPCSTILYELIGDDHDGGGPMWVDIIVRTISGKEVIVRIPNDQTPATVCIDNNWI